MLPSIQQTLNEISQIVPLNTLKDPIALERFTDILGSDKTWQLYLKLDDAAVYLHTYKTLGGTPQSVEGNISLSNIEISTVIVGKQTLENMSPALHAQDSEYPKTRAEIFDRATMVMNQLEAQNHISRDETAQYAGYDNKASFEAARNEAGIAAGLIKPTPQTPTLGANQNP